MIEVWMDAIIFAFSFLNLFLVIMGVTIGIVFGALPGLGPTLAVALMLPVTFGFEPASALIFLAGVYAGAIYGGSITAILLNAPGTPGSGATTFDGYPLARQGKAGLALGLSVTSSMFGGVFGVIMLIILSSLLAKFSIYFGSAETFMLALFGISIIAVVAKASLRKGLIAGGMGLIFSFIGQDLMTGQFRFTFDLMALSEGIPFVIGLVGLFAFSEGIRLAEEKGSVSKTGKITSSVMDGVKMTFKYPKTVIKSSIIGTFIGALPGAGLSAANFISYGEAKRKAKDPDSFGEGNPEGVIAAEASNNAVMGGSLVPTLVLGIPGNSTTAVFLSAIMLHGLRPGFDLFTTNVDVTYSLFVGLILSSLVFFILGFSFTKLFAKVTIIKNKYLIPIIFILCIVGAIALRNRFTDVYLLLIFGLVGYFLKKYGFPVVGVVLGMILGSIAERGFQQTMMIYGYSGFFTRPVSLGIFLIIVLTMSMQFLKPYLQKVFGKKSHEN